MCACVCVVACVWVRVCGCVCVGACLHVDGWVVRAHTSIMRQIGADMFV